MPSNPVSSTGLRSRALRSARGAALASVLLAVSGQAADAAELQGFKARYQASYRGISGGQIEMTLRRDAAPNRWIYETRAYPNLLGRVAVSPDARGRASMLVTPQGVQPLGYEYEDGTSNTTGDLRYQYDWSAMRVTGAAGGRSLDLPLPPSTQDTASIQPAVMNDLLAGRAPAGYPILTGSKLRPYRYWSEGRGSVETPAGRYEAVIWASQREGSDRVSKVWHAPELGFLPVQVVQYRKGKAETVLRLLQVEPEAAADRGP